MNLGSRASNSTTALAVHPDISSTVYAAVHPPDADWSVPTTIYETSDGAASWTAVYRAPRRVTTLAAGGLVVYAGAYNRDEIDAHPPIHYSGDGGMSWNDALPVAGGTIWDVDIHPSLPQTAIAGGGDYPDRAFLYKTMDGGITWTEIFSYSLPGGCATVNAVLIHPIDTSIWLLSHDGEVGDTFGSYIWRSTDGGDSWDLTLVTTNTVESIVIDQLQPDVVYVADDDYSVLKSDDGGDSWTVVRSMSAGSSGNRLAIDPNVSGHVFLGGFGYIAETVDGGATWSESNDHLNQSTPEMEPSVLAVDSGMVTQTVYAGFTGVWAYSRPALQSLRVYLPVVVRGYTP